MTATPERGPQPVAPDPPSGLHEAIRRRAEEIYDSSGRIPGRDLQNWYQAETEILRGIEDQPVSKAAIVVNVQGVHYVGEYMLAASGGYSPGEFASSEAVAVRLEGDRMFVRRPNGQELETRIVSKSG